MLQKIESIQRGAYQDEYDGKSVPEWINAIIDAINQMPTAGTDVKLQSFSLDGSTLTATLSDNTSVQVNLASLSAGREYTTLSTGALSLFIVREAGNPPVLTQNSVGDYTLSVGAGSEIISIDVIGNNTTITGTGDFIFRIDNDSNGRPKKMLTQLYNLGNNALVDAHAQGNNHTRVTIGNVTTYTYPNMQPFGAAGFEINLR